jgi:hypothetical protein
MSKHQRLDAIERRLAYLEANAAGEGEDRDPRYSCTPLSDDPNDPPDTVVIGTSLDGREIRYTPLQHRQFAADDVRERLSKRSSLADGTWGLSTEPIEVATDPLPRTSGLPLEQWDERARRYEASLMALHAMLQPEHDGGHRFDRSDYSCLIEGCLEGGVITPEGLQRDE